MPTETPTLTPTPTLTSTPTITPTPTPWDQTACGANGGYWANDGLGGQGCWFLTVEYESCAQKCANSGLVCRSGNWNDDSNCTVCHHFFPDAFPGCYEPSGQASGAAPHYEWWAAGAKNCHYRAEGTDKDCSWSGWIRHVNICVCEP